MDKKKLAVYCTDVHDIMDASFCSLISQYYRLCIFAPPEKINYLKQKEIVADFVPYPKMLPQCWLSSDSLLFSLEKKIRQFFLLGKAFFITIKLKRSLETRGIKNVVFTTTNHLRAWMALIPCKVHYHVFFHNIHHWYKVQLDQYRDNHSKGFRLFLSSLFLKKIKSGVVLTQYLREEISHYTNIPIAVFPFVTFSENRLKQREKILKTVTIPTFTLLGAVNNEKKYYKQIVDVFAKITKEYTLIFLGRVISNEEILYAKQKLGNKVVSFSGYIEDEEYENTLCSSHFIINNNLTKQPYGLYKASGMEFESAVYCVPLIKKEGGDDQYEGNLEKLITDAISSVLTGKYYEQYEKMNDLASI